MNRELVSEDGKALNNPGTKYICIPCNAIPEFVMYHDIVVRTKEKDVFNFVNDKSGNFDIGDINIMQQVSENVLKYSYEQVDEMFHANTKDWTDWCEDVVLYCCYRKAIFGIPIPLVFEVNQCQNNECPKNGKFHCSCRTVRYCSKECQKKNWEHHKAFCSEIRNHPNHK